MEMVGFDNQYNFVGLHCALVESNRLRLISGSTEVPDFRDLHKRIHGHQIYEANQSNYWKSIDPLLDAGVKHLGTINLKSRFGGSSTKEVRAYELPRMIGMESNRLIYLETREINNAAPPGSIISFTTAKLLVIPDNLIKKSSDFTEIEGTILSFTEGIELTAKEKDKGEADQDNTLFAFGGGSKDDVDYYFKGKLLETLDSEFFSFESRVGFSHLGFLEQRFHRVEQDGEVRLKEVPCLTYEIDALTRSVSLENVPITIDPAGKVVKVVVGEFGDLRLIKGLTEEPFIMDSTVSPLEEGVLAEITIDEGRNGLKAKIKEYTDETGKEIVVVFNDLPANKFHWIKSLMDTFSENIYYFIKYEHQIEGHKESNEKYEGISVIKPPVYKLVLIDFCDETYEAIEVNISLGNGEVTIEQ